MTRSKKNQPVDLSEEQLGRLIEAAGKRPRYDEELAALRPAVERAWRARVAREQRDRDGEPARATPRPSPARVLAWAAGLLAVLAVGWLVARGFAPRDVAAEALAAIVAVSGEPDGGQAGWAPGDELSEGAVLNTGSVRLALQMRDGESVRVDRRTRVLVEGPRRLILESGRIYVDSDPNGTGAQGAGLAIETPFGVARDIGTQFAVEVGAAALTVRVREGLVELERQRRKLTVAAGEELRAAREGTITRRGIEPTAPEWAWIRSIPHPFEIEGATVFDYLVWVGRETGLRVRFETPEVRARAHDTVLHGSNEGLGPLSGLEVFLLSAGLEHRIEGADLVVEQDE